MFVKNISCRKLIMNSSLKNGRSFSTHHSKNYSLVSADSVDACKNEEYDKKRLLNMVRSFMDDNITLEKKIEENISYLSIETEKKRLN